MERYERIRSIDPADEDLIFRSLDEKTNGLVRIKKDGRERVQITRLPVLEKSAVFAQR